MEWLEHFDELMDWVQPIGIDWYQSDHHGRTVFDLAAGHQRLAVRARFRALLAHRQKLYHEPVILRHRLVAHAVPILPFGVACLIGEYTCARFLDIIKVK